MSLNQLLDEELRSACVWISPRCALSVNDVAALQLIAPTEEEITMARAATRTLADAPDGAVAAAGMRGGERFVVALLDVPQFDRKLQVILLLLTFGQHASSISAAIAQLHTAASRVTASSALRRCFAVCLRVGNTLNRGTARAGAVGFDLAVLPTLGAVKSSSDTSYSLLHFMATLLQREEEEEAAEGEQAKEGAKGGEDEKKGVETKEGEGAKEGEASKEGASKEGASKAEEKPRGSDASSSLARPHGGSDLFGEMQSEIATLPQVTSRLELCCHSCRFIPT